MFSIVCIRFLFEYLLFLVLSFLVYKLEGEKISIPIFLIRMGK